MANLTATPPASAAAATDAAVHALLHGALDDPFALLGPHAEGEGILVRSFQPGAVSVAVQARRDGATLLALSPLGDTGLWQGWLQHLPPYSLRIVWADAVQDSEDPYSFGLLLGELDLHLFAEGRHRELGRCLGAQAMLVEGIAGVRFAVWAPGARRVSVVGAFNGWDGRRHPMRRRIESGVWELFIPRLAPGTAYQFELLDANGAVRRKADPLAQQAELAPGTASIVADPTPFAWTDAGWLQARRARQAEDAPISIYEVHAGSWQREAHGHGAVPDWDALAARLVPYVAGLGFTHVELLPIMEHPFGGSWGYQPLGLFAPTARHGSPAAFARFVDACHDAGLGVILDWVPAHFPADERGLRRFE